MTAGSGGAAGFAICHPGNDRVEEPLTAYVRTLAEAQCPHDAVVVRTAVQLRDAARAAADRYGQAVKRADETIGRDHGHGYYPRATTCPTSPTAPARPSSEPTPPTPGSTGL